MNINLASMPFVESLSGTDGFVLLTLWPPTATESIAEPELKGIVKELLALAQIPYEAITVERVESNENPDSYGLSAKIQTPHGPWQTRYINVYKKRPAHFSGSELAETLNALLKKAESSNRFFEVYSEAAGDDGNLYRYAVDLVFAGLPAAKKLIAQLQATDHVAHLRQSGRNAFVNRELRFAFNPGYEETNERASFQFRALLPDGLAVNEAALNNLDFRYFDDYLWSANLRTFWLWDGVNENYQLAGEVVARYLSHQGVEVRLCNEGIALLANGETKHIAHLPTEDGDKANTPALVRTLNTLLKKHGAEARIYRYVKDYSTTHDYFLCNQKTGETLFRLLQSQSAFPPNATFSRLDVSLLYEDEIISVGISNEAKKKFLGIDVPAGEAWESLFSHFLTLDNHKLMPGKKWLQSLAPLVEAIGTEAYAAKAVNWLQACIEKSIAKQKDENRWDKWGAQQGLLVGTGQLAQSLKDAASPEWVRKVYGENYGYGEKNAIYTRNGFYFYYTLGGRILRGIIHSAALVNDKKLLALVDDFAVKNPDEAADAIHVYTQLPPALGVPRLTRLRSKTKKKTIRTRIETAFKKIGESLRLSADEVEELSVGDYGLDGSHKLTRTFGDHAATFSVDGVKKTTLLWADGRGKQQSAVPAKVKAGFAAELKELKADIKEIESQLPVQRDRIEGFYSKERSWNYEAWLALYIAHPLLGVLGKSLIWHFSNDTQKAEGIWDGEKFVNADGEPLKWMDRDTQVRLWHPLGFSAGAVLAWRRYLSAKELTQPFKQAFREVYILTDAELHTHSYSNRFAGHILNREHFGALCKARGWTPNAMATGQPTKRLPHWNLTAEYWVQEIWLGQESSFYGSAHITTDQVRFYQNKRQLNMDEVPALAFSEIMRDVDLFTGITSIGNDPAWADRGEGPGRTYCESYAFGELSESAKLREQALRNLIPRLKIAPQCSFAGKFLTVKGKLRTYKIHMGSGNILMEPNDQYLCIVPDASKSKPGEKLYLPFEGDGTLSLIISKALLLAADDKISDPTIVRQIQPA